MIHIREAKPTEAPTIVNFQIEMARETENLQLDRSLVTPGVEAVFEDNAKGRYYIAEIDDTIVGSLLTTYEWSDWRNGNVLWIQSVFVQEAYRGRGVYRQMWSFIKNMVLDTSSEYCGVRLYVDKSNLAAQQVYQKLGMANHHYDMYEWMGD
ncbi:MAG: GNAT family N-acetyltransferase [Cyclobacteriaceae bacterium]|nr:GNAT family N-acetyltransferase [Cyclobacteriaceae bacterium]